jgi:hypothetical protein
MSASIKVLGLALALALAGCSGGAGGTTAPEPDTPAPPAQPTPPPPPPASGPVDPAPNPGVQGSYVLAQINNSQPGQLVTIANPDGMVIGLYRFEATTLTLDALQTFELALRYTDDKALYGIEDEGEFKQARSRLPGRAAAHLQLGRIRGLVHRRSARGHRGDQVRLRRRRATRHVVRVPA